jgi:hypothetical protein
VTGSFRRVEWSRSKMSYTPWLDGSIPVRNDGHADHEWFGTVDISVPLAPLRISAARFGRIPASNIGSRILQSAPSQPMRRTRGIAG